MNTFIHLLHNVCIYSLPYPNINHFTNSIPQLNEYYVPTGSTTSHKKISPYASHDQDDDIIVVILNTTSSCDRVDKSIEHSTIIKDLNIPTNILGNGRGNKIAQKWKQQIANRQKRKLAKQQLVINATKTILNIPKNHAIIDTGVAGHFLLRGAPCKNMKADHVPLTVDMPKGATASSLYECELDFSGL